MLLRIEQKKIAFPGGSQGGQWRKGSGVEQLGDRLGKCSPYDGPKDDGSGLRQEYFFLVAIDAVGDHRSDGDGKEPGRNEGEAGQPEGPFDPDDESLLARENTLFLTFSEVFVDEILKCLGKKNKGSHPDHSPDGGVEHHFEVGKAIACRQGYTAQRML